MAAFAVGCKLGNRRIANTAFANLVPMMYKLGDFGYVSKLYASYLRLTPKSGRHAVPDGYTSLLYKGYLALYQGRHDEAVAIFGRQVAVLGGDAKAMRMRFNAYENLALALAEGGRYDQAIDAVTKMKHWADIYDLKDGKIEVYRLLADYMQKAGRDGKADAYMREYYLLKDSLQNYQRVMSVGQLDFIGRIEAANRKVQAMQERHRAMAVGGVVALLLASVVSVSLAIVWRKNKTLRQANRALYSKNSELLAADEELRRLHKRELVELRASMECAKDQAAQKKYRSSQLSEVEKQSLVHAIKDVMERGGEIFDPDFSVGRLSELVGRNSKYVSQVINERMGGNFNRLLNEYRVREACRRINSSGCANITIEALANNLGFKSRTSLTTAFKSQTGLSPSEYIRIANEGRAQ